MHIMDILRPYARAERPAVLRIGFNGFSAIHNALRRPTIRNIHRQPANRFHPVGVCRVLSKPVPPKVADALFETAQVVNVLALVGLAHKATGPANALLQLWTITYRNSFGMILHNDNMLVMQQMAVGFSPSADAVSVDSWIRDRTLLPERYSRSYGGVNTLANIAATAVYFISGVAKVRNEYGWGWASGVALKEQIAADAVRKETFGSEAPQSAKKLYHSGGPLGVLAAGALAIELLSPLALFNRRVGRVFGLAACAMHWGIRLVMGIKFTYNMSGISYLGYFPVGPELR